MAKVGVILSGCGVYDGSEIHEAVITLLALNRAGADVICMAPNMEQTIVNHLTGEPVAGVTRNVLEESARIVRGDIRDIATVDTAELDALFLPGGFGAAKNLCNFAEKGSNCEVHPEVARVVKEIVTAKKPLAAVCIAPALVAKVLGDNQLEPQVTIGTDKETAETLTALGATHLSCPVNEFVVDSKNKIITSPAYMLAGNISEAAEGIEKTVAALMQMIGPST
ncbi:Enhancing lycopene biosynthesis protein 2 [Desulfuromusa kysingii]|uniref:Enhancing lycopene biosynthesis protein 2 n=1 Tax=Desulfuromusa kysingii TaxID=37625 RepID=A0A1H3W8U9_9BACT|nr:isoprenoid biosynthesis glyoxalase ElbB [Desulfuromusa kysingii]SDZ82772.1 Enhancing lycopene biosynthesis protein 2 [Desulfuromusa kysingii]